MADLNSRFIDYSSNAPKPIIKAENKRRGDAERSRSYISNAGNHIYYNIVIPHSHVNNPTNAPTPAVFTETRSTPIVNDPEDFLLSVVRWQIPCQFIPIFINQGYFLPGQPLSTSASVTLSYGGNNIQQFIYHVPEDRTITQPQDPRTLIRDPATGQLVPIGFTTQGYLYYAVYSYQAYVNQINTALAAAFVLLPLPVVAPPYQAPYMIYDSFTNLFSIIVDQRLPAIGFQLYFSEVTYRLFVPSFNVIIQGYSTPLGKDILFNLENDNNNNYIPSPVVAGVNFWQMRQERPTIDNWYSAKSLVMTVSNVPIRSEFTPNSTGDDVANIDGFVRTGSSASNSFLPILTDFIPTLQNKAGDFLTNVTYTPTAEYRLIDLIGSDPLQTVSIQIYWSDNYLRLFPLLIWPHQICNIKLLFRNKNYYNGQLK